MDLLPLELNVKIFSLLNLDDLMTLRLVCKKFECIVREVKIRELIIQKDFSPFEDIKKVLKKISDGGLWFSTNELKEPSEVFSPNILLRSSFPSGGPLNFRFLRRLSIESLRDTKGLKLEDINRLEHLEHLEIGFDQQPRKSSVESRFDKKIPDPCLSLPNLKVLKIINFYKQKHLDIDAPRLRALELPDLSQYISKYFKEYTGYDPNDLARIREHLERNENYLARVEEDLARLGDNRFKANLQIFLYAQDYLNDIVCLYFKHPASIRCFSIFDINKYSQAPQIIRKFRNVEHLLVFDKHLLNRTTGLAFLVEDFEKLKQLTLRNGCLSVNVSSIVPLVNWVTSLQRPELKVYFLDILISNNPNFIHDFDFYRQAFEREIEGVSQNERERKIKELFLNEREYEITMQLKNYSLLPDRIDTHSLLLRYNELVEKLLKMQADRDGKSGGNQNESMLASLFPVDFFDRFPRITGMSGSRIENESHFTHLVKINNNLKGLSLEDSGLSQAFFEQLPAISLLNCLELIERNQLNMNFLSRMSHLFVCTTNQQLKPEIVLKLAKTRNFRNICCKIDDRTVIISRKAKDKYCLKIDSVENVVSFESLTDHLNEKAGPKTTVLELFWNFLAISILLAGIYICQL